MPNILHRLTIDAPLQRVHELVGWREESEFMHGCSTNWASYLMSLKAGAEGRGFAAYPDGEVSRWD